jgi:hypothetical protein
MNTKHNQVAMAARNRCIKQAYLKIYKEAKALISSIEEQPVRQILEREDKAADERGTKVHELVGTILYLSLECDLLGEYDIHYGWDQSDKMSDYYALTSAFIRFVYKFTMADATPINIEDCVSADYVVPNCSELFEYVEDRSRHHTSKVLKYKALHSKAKELPVYA